MKGKKTQIIAAVILIVVISNSLWITAAKTNEQTEITIHAKTIPGLPHEYLNLIVQQLKAIGIDLVIAYADYPTYIPEDPWWMLQTELCLTGMYSSPFDPDYTGVYNENGSLNLANYHTAIDFDEELNTGLNEWYIQEGQKIFPPYSEEREAHYYEWQNYLMDKILPCQPLLSVQEHYVCKNYLKGFNFSKGILQSWGNMYWDMTTNPSKENELVIGGWEWENLNPLFTFDSASLDVISYVLDPLFWCDMADNSFQPHLATEIEHVSDTQVRISLREGIKWQDDPDGLFIDEEFNAEDVYFTFSVLKNLAWNSYDYSWVRQMKIIDDFTIDFYIDSDLDTPEADYDHQYYTRLFTNILPEHYLNQTQLEDGVTPDTNHISWDKFSQHCFGTGLFELQETNDKSETILIINDDSWWLNSTITSDSRLAWTRRFGTFTNYFEQLRIKNTNNHEINFKLYCDEEIDYCQVFKDNFDKIILPDCAIGTQENIIYSKPGSVQSVLFYNLRPNLLTGNTTPCYFDSSMTIGLAVRKAISYAIDRNEINRVIHGNRSFICDHPIGVNLGHWLSPNIIKYNYNLEKAKSLLALTGLLGIVTNTPPVGIPLIESTILIAGIISIGVMQQKKKSK